MPLIPGATLGPYEISAKIGEGGMGSAFARASASFPFALAHHR